MTWCGYPVPADLVLLSPDELGVTVLLHFSADVPVRPCVDINAIEQTSEI